jgi:hypothetical protein
VVPAAGAVDVRSYEKVTLLVAPYITGEVTDVLFAWKVPGTGAGVLAPDAQVKEALPVLAMVVLAVYPPGAVVLSEQVWAFASCETATKQKMENEVKILLMMIMFKV